MRAHRHTFASYMADAFESPEQRALCIVAASVGRSEAVATGQTGQYDFTSVNTQRGAKRVVAARSRNGAHNGAAITVAVLLRILVERFQRLRLFRNDKHERVPSAVTFSSPLAAALLYLASFGEKRIESRACWAGDAKTRECGGY